MAYNNFSLDPSLPPTLPIHVHTDFMLKIYINQLSYVSVLAEVTEPDLMLSTEKAWNANAPLRGGLKWIHLSIPELSLAFTYIYKLSNWDKNFVSGFVKLLCFLCPYWPEIEAA